MRGDASRRQLAVAAVPQCLDSVHDLLTDLWVEVADVAVQDRVRFETAVVEVADNIVAQAAGRTDVELQLTVEATPDRLEADFRDTGAEAVVDLDSACLPDDMAEEGRGLAIVRAAVDEVSYDREDDVNHWHLVQLRRV